jgi:hypothetical protein
MIRKLLQSTLCFFLSSMLVAQQAAAPTAGAPIPARIDLDLMRVGQVRFLSPGMASLERIRRGRIVQFELSADAAFGNEILIPANVPVTGVVVRVKRPVRRRHQDGLLFIHVTEVLSGKSTDVIVRCSNPADPYRAPDFEERGDHAKLIGAIVAIVLVIGMYIAVAIVRPE